MLIREPIVAGQFYPADADSCQNAIRGLLEELSTDDNAATPVARPVAGLVPHAGWMCSGKVAMRVLRFLASFRNPETIVLFGGVHRYRGEKAAMFCSGRWETPVGSVAIDDRLAERILSHTNLIADDPHAHTDEHSLEVQMPLIWHFFPGVQVVPIMVPIISRAHEVGAAVARTLTSYDYDALIVGTTDLTHYGPSYGFAPHGTGPEGILWAKEKNDHSFIDLVCGMKEREVVVEANERRNACNPGATAATIAAAKALGASEGILLEHTTSYEVLSKSAPSRQQDSVGYAGIVFA